MGKTKLKSNKWTVETNSSNATSVSAEITVAQDASGAYGISDADMQKIADTMMPQ